MKIKTGDTVKVLSGAEKKGKGKTGVVLSANPKEGMITVEGVNEVKRHVRRSQRNLQGGRLTKVMPIPVSKVMLVCPACGKPTRVGYDFVEKTDGNGESAKTKTVKVRVCKKCKAEIVNEFHRSKK